MYGKVGRGRDDGCEKWVEPADLPTPHVSLHNEAII